MNVNMGCDKYPLTLLVPFRSILYLLMFTLHKKNLVFCGFSHKKHTFFPTGLPKTKCNRLISVPLPPPLPPPQRLMKFSDIAFWLIALLSCPSLLDKSEYSFYEGNGPVRSPITPVPIVNNLQVI